MTNMPPTPPDIIQAFTAMRSHWHSMKSEIAVKKEEIAHNQGELADMKEELAKTERGIRALEDIFGPMSETERAKTNRRAGAGRVAVKDCPLTLARRREIGEKHVALCAIAEATPSRVVHTRTVARWLIEAELMPDHMDNARVSLTSYMRLRPNIWEPAERGYFRLIAPVKEGIAAQETGGEIPEPESNDIRSFTL